MVPRSLPFLFLLSLPLISCHPNPSLFDGLYADPLDDVHAWSPGTHRPPSASTHFAPRDDEKKRMKKSLLGKAWTGHASTLVNAGETGVSAMQISVVDDDHVIIFDKEESNALQTHGESAWASIYTISTQKVRALFLTTNSFCAGGGWKWYISVNRRKPTREENYTENGLTAVRMFTPCDDDLCQVYENPNRTHLTSKRWYASTVRLDDGSLMILGGMVAGGFNNQEATDNPTFEFFPPKGDGLQIFSQFLHDALNTNLFPITWLLPNGLIFVAANELAMLYDWRTNTEHRLKGFLNGVKINYPDSPAAVLLPLTMANNWKPEVLFCGGSTSNSDESPVTLSATYPASTQCSRMVITPAGLKAGWKIEQMPSPRVMGDAVITPDGKILIVNGATEGVAGYGNVLNEIGSSNSRRPNNQAVLYDPLAASGSRFTSDFPKSKYERLYHSSATLLPSGAIMISGSNPNGDVSTTTYRTRYNVEMLNPPYMFAGRPTYTGAPGYIAWGKNFGLNIILPNNTTLVQAVLIDLGYSTHAVHMDHRYVELITKRSSSNPTSLTVTGPQSRALYPPGYAWLYILADGIPSLGKRVMVGTGGGPPVSQSAINNLNKKTASAA